MLMTKRKPATIGEILVEEFMKPSGLTQGALAEAMGVQHKHVDELCNNRSDVTAATALILARVFGSSADFWLNVQRRSDMWEAMHSA
jgi:addiction module HigA family antidote